MLKYSAKLESKLIKMSGCTLMLTTDYGRPVRKSPSLHGRKSNSIPNLLVRLKHILSATSAQFFRFVPSLGVRSPWME